MLIGHGEAKRKDVAEDEPAAQSDTLSLHDELKRSERYAARLDRLNRFESEIHQVSSKEALFAFTADCMRELFDAQRTSVTLVNESQTSFDVYALNQDMPKGVWVGSTLPMEGTAMGMAIRNKCTTALVDLASSPYIDCQKLHKVGIRSVLLVPFALNERVVGSINIGSTRMAAFDTSDEDLLVRLSEAVARGLDHRRLIAEVKNATEENRDTQALLKRLRRLNEIGNQLNATLSEQDACALLVQRLIEIIRFERGELILLDGTGTPQPFTLRASGSSAEPASPERAHMLDQDFHSILEAPLLDGEKELGLIRLRHEDLHSYTERDRQLLDQAASLFAAAIRNLRLIDNAKNAQATAEASSAAKSIFVANISHEIRTPLNAIIGMTSLLASSGLEGEKQQFVETIRSSGESLLSVVNEVLDFSKIEANKVELENQPFSLSHCVEDVVELFATPTARKDLQLSKHIDPALPEVVIGDITRLRQVLVNLVGNATKFTEKGGIEIKAARQEGDSGADTCVVQFVVIDSGIGMTHSQLDALFEPFAQGDSSMTRRYGGTGLGLVIARRLVELMGGRIWAESALGRGSSFHFTVRLQVADGTAEQLAERRTSESGAALSVDEQMAERHPLDILLAEDNKTNQLVMLNILKRLGYRADVAADGLEVLTALERQSYDVVLMDMQMPHMDGLSATTRIRKRRGQKERPQIIAITANASEEDARRCLDAGMNDYLSKPVRIKGLIQTLIAAARRLPPADADA